MRIITSILYNIKYRGFTRKLNEMNQKQYLDSDNGELLHKLKSLLIHSSNNVPYYQNLFRSLSLDISSINSIEDLKKIPLSNKSLLLNQIDKFKATNYINKKIIMTTGGSSGIPLKYWTNKKDMEISKILKFRGFMNGGYKFGDKIVYFAGGSLVKKANIKSRLIKYFSNIKSVSTYGITESKMSELLNYIDKKKVKYIYGYASSLYFLATYFEKNYEKFNINLNAIFTTSEVLTQIMREKIEKVFKTKIFDDYGINDGGASAHECKYHNGLHFDTERSIIEIVDDYGNIIDSGKGKLVVTNLYNYAMPFIRYDTGDIVEVSNEPCECGKKSKRITKIHGRETDYINIDDVYIGSPVLTVLMGKIDIDLYQIVQKKDKTILFRLLDTTDSQKRRDLAEKTIRKSFNDMVPNAVISFEFYTDSVTFKPQNKYKMIFRESDNEL